MVNSITFRGKRFVVEGFLSRSFLCRGDDGLAVLEIAQGRCGCIVKRWSGTDRQRGIAELFRENPLERLSVQHCGDILKSAFPSGEPVNREKLWAEYEKLQGSAGHIGDEEYYERMSRLLDAEGLLNFIIRKIAEALGMEVEPATNPELSQNDQQGQCPQGPVP